jgi:hypothetical protein
MTGHLGPVVVECDAPAYDIVYSSEAAGMSSPLDVRWCRLSHAPDLPPPRPSFWDRARQVFGSGRPRPRGCSCGKALPDLDRFQFVFLGRSVGEFLLGQCRRCKTVYWEPLCPCSEDD